MCYRAKLFGYITMVSVTLTVFLYETHGSEVAPPGRVGVHGMDQFTLIGNGAELQSWEFISPSGDLIPDPDGDASPWLGYLSNEPTNVHAIADPSNPVLVDGFLPIDVGTTSFYGFDFWYTSVDGTRVPGPIFPLSGVSGTSFELLVDLQDGTLEIAGGGGGDHSWTYSYSIESASGALVPDPDGDSAPYLTYLHNTETLVSAATSNAVVLQDSLVLDARFAGPLRDLVFKYEILGDEQTPPTWLHSVQGTVRYTPEPGTFALLVVGAGCLLLRVRRQGK